MSNDNAATAWLTDIRVRLLIDNALTRADLRGLDIDEAEVRKRVLAQTPRLTDGLRVELAAHQKANTVADGVSAELDKRLVRLKWGQVAGNALAGAWLLLLLQSMYRIDWPWPHVHFGVFPSWDNSFTAMLFAGFTCAAVIIGNFALRAIKNAIRRRHRNSAVQREVANTGVNLTDRAQTEVEALVREAVNVLDAPDAATGSLLTTAEAPALVDLNTVDTVSSVGLRQVEEFIDRHPTSAIGVAGPRGVGKSTVLRRVSANSVGNEQRKQRVGVYVQSPVYYQAADFVRTLHEEIARSILEDAHERFETPELRIERRIRALRRAITALFFFCGLALSLIAISGSSLPTIPPSGVLGGVLIGVAYIYLFFDLAASRAGRRAGRYASDEVLLAQREIRKLTWNANVSNKEKTVLKLLPGLNSDSEQQVAYAERDRSHPDRVADLRNFLQEFRRISRVPVVVAIDELDKMASAEQAIEAVNGLKDLFHMQSTHFVVSVSEDALAGFALRGVPVRDVFDSSFDDVVRMRPFSAEDSVNLLLGRTVKFPRAASLFCHALSGGLPRDLIRAARRTVDVRRLAGEDMHVEAAFRVVVREDLIEAVEAAGVRAREHGTTDDEVSLFKLKLAVADSSELSLSDLTARPELLTSVARELASFVLTLVTIREFFEQLLQQKYWRQSLKAPETIALIDELAMARAQVGTSQLDCVRRIVEIRKRAQLAPIPDSITHRTAPSLAAYNGRANWRKLVNVSPRWLPRGRERPRADDLGQRTSRGNALSSEADPNSASPRAAAG
ncbi:P-loop NTPase fold protein [Amycolatopsis sp. 195334CR]|uniref:P-loop NTPase fold protein n=1 Tax=Amycolatopsis sp. 195334CR TaxID=2814588 RepID=UPI001F5CEC2E|nr:P-loop NTPase fold protein [Amycolatopsis sp. 195334CR]